MHDILPKTIHETDTSLEALKDLDDLGVDCYSTRQLSDIVNIVGVLADIKPVTIIDDEFHDDASRQRLLGLVDALGMTSHEATLLNGVKSIFISKDTQKAILLNDLWNELFLREISDRDDVERGIGKLLGFPETAIDFYIKRGDEYNITPAAPQSGEPFHRLVLSPENTESERAEYCVPLEDATRELLPRTYQHIAAVEEMRGRHGFVVHQS